MDLWVVSIHFACRFDVKCFFVYYQSVGARAVVHIAQFNGKQERRPRKANLTCAAPATVSGRIRKDSASITATEGLEQALGKAMGVVPPARIPANNVAVRLFTSALL